MNEKSTGTSFLSFLGLLFIGLKLTNYIDWSWWWVTLPFWGGLALVVVGAAVFFGVTGVVVLCATLMACRARARRQALLRKQFKEKG